MNNCLFTFLGQPDHDKSHKGLLIVLSDEKYLIECVCVKILILFHTFIVWMHLMITHLDRYYCKIIFVLVDSLVAGIKIGIYIY